MAWSSEDLPPDSVWAAPHSRGRFLDRTVEHCAANANNTNDLVEARLFDDMAPLHFQIEAAWHHSVWGIKAVLTGEFAPPSLVGPVPFAELRGMISLAVSALEALTA